MNLTQGVKNLLIANILVFALLFFNSLPFDASFVLYSFGSDRFDFFQLISYMFLHASLSHIILNMIGLITFGPELENYFGKSKFLSFYFICGVIGGLSHSLLSTSPVVGASAAIWGLMFVYAIINPNRILHIYFLLPVKAKWIIGLFFSIELMLAITGSSDGVSHFAHIGGAVSGDLFYFFNKKSDF